MKIRLRYRVMIPNIAIGLIGLIIVFLVSGWFVRQPGGGLSDFLEAATYFDNGIKIMAGLMLLFMVGRVFMLNASDRNEYLVGYSFSILFWLMVFCIYFLI